MAGTTTSEAEAGYRRYLATHPEAAARVRRAEQMIAGRRPGSGSHGPARVVEEAERIAGRRWEAHREESTPQQRLDRRLEEAARVSGMSKEYILAVFSARLHFLADQIQQRAPWLTWPQAFDAAVRSVLARA